jgi:hypothetical protein
MAKLSGPEIKVLAHLWSRALESGQTFSPISKLSVMDATGLTHKEVAQAVRSLAIKGLILAMPQSEPGSDAWIGLAPFNVSTVDQNNGTYALNGSLYSTPSKPWIGIPAPNDFYVPADDWKWLLWSVYNRQHVLLVGPTGCGKTELVYKLAKAANRTVYAINMGATSDARSALIGVTHLRAGQAVFIESPFVKGIQDPMGLILLDEINRAGADAANLLYPVLDGQRFLSLDEADPPKTIAVHPDVVVFPTANLGGGYTGTRPMRTTMPAMTSSDSRLRRPDNEPLVRRLPVLKTYGR